MTCIVHKRPVWPLTLLCLLVLSACNNSVERAGNPPTVLLAATSTAPDYTPIVQQLYIAYFGRPADPGGLASFASQLAALGGPTDLQLLPQAAQFSPSLRALIDSFSTSAESAALYGSGDNNAFVTAIYRNVLNRAPDAEGLAYWAEALRSGSLSRTGAAIAIMAGALANKTPQGLLDAGLVNNKITAGTIFTDTITSTQNFAYSGDAAAAAARTMLSTISATYNAQDLRNSATALVDALKVSDVQAARFLLQAQFSASTNEIASVRAKGPAAWLAEQTSAPAGTKGWDWLDANGYSVASNARYYDAEYVTDRMVWNQLMTAPDAVRKRAALALSEIMVVSIAGVELVWRNHSMAAYWDTLSANAFGNYRTLLEQVTLNAATGKYLNTMGNQKENAAGRQPDENYAREVMQLYTIGLYQLNQDGTEKHDGSGGKFETYSSSDVSNLARVFTGYEAQLATGNKTLVQEDNGRLIPTTSVAQSPMRLVASNHSTLAVNFLNVSIPAGTEASAALKLALDGLFNHPNVGPFIGKQLIQRMVTSNPSPAYVARVAAAFNNNGNGVRGDLKAVFHAILLDDEARSDGNAAQDGFGKVREPMLRLVQWGRTFADLSTRASWKINDLSNPATQLGQSPLHASSVFNFFRPGYVPPSTSIASSGRVAPEFQIINESSVGGYLNYMQGVIRNGFSTPNSDIVGNTAGSTSIPANYADELAIVTDASALVARLNLLLCAGRLSSATQTLIVQTLNASTVTAASTSSQKLDRIGLAVFLVMASPEYLIQK
jgi:uncharacterized protein (DUF1800 family)